MYTRRLQSIELFAGLEEDTLKAVAACAKETSVEAGHVLVREGDYAYELSIIEEGSARVSADGREVATLGEGDMFGELGLLRRSLRGATVTALTDMRLISLSGWDLRRLRRAHPALLERIRDVGEERVATS